MQNASQKKEIRKIFLEKRLLMLQEEVEEKSRLISINLFTNFFLLRQNIGIYMPIKNEVNPLHVRKYNINNLSLPCVKNGEMHFKEWLLNSPLKTGKYDILEPLEKAKIIMPDIIITPLVTFDERCFRVGYGGGFYDKFFENFKGIKIGLAFEGQKCKKIINEKFDIKLDYIITESSIYH